MTATSLDVERRSRRSFTASDVCACTGITYRQLDYWTRTGLVHASGHPSSGTGDVRWYRDSDVLRIYAVAALVNAGVSLATVREHIDQVLDDGRLLTRAVTITVDLLALLAHINAYRRAAS